MRTVASGSPSRVTHRAGCGRRQWLPQAALAFKAPRGEVGKRLVLQVTGRQLDHGMGAVLCLDHRQRLGAVGEKGEVAPVGEELGLFAGQAGTAHDQNPCERRPARQARESASPGTRSRAHTWPKVKAQKSCRGLRARRRGGAGPPRCGRCAAPRSPRCSRRRAPSRSASPPLCGPDSPRPGARRDPRTRRQATRSPALRPASPASRCR